jgi:hypothetical protein
MDQSTEQWKRFHKSNSLIYQYIMVLMDGKQERSLLRRVVGLEAAPGVTTQDIMSEIQRLDDVAEVAGALNGPLAFFYSDPHMNTISVETPEFVVCLTLAGFKKIAYENAVSPDGTLTVPIKRHQLQKFACSLVASRDYATYGGNENKNHEYLDYYLKELEFFNLNP